MLKDGLRGVYHPAVLLRTAAVVTLLVAQGCARSPQMRAVGWVEVETEGIRLRTDASAERAVELAGEMQLYRDVLVGMFFQCAGDSRDPLDVTVLDHDGDFDDIAGRGRDGFFRSSSLPWIGPVDQVVLRHRGGRHARRTFAHELTHRLLAACFPTAPVWLHEGFASLFETAYVEDGTLHVGLPPFVAHDGAGLSRTEFRGVDVVFVPRSLVPGVAELRAMDPALFYAYDGGASPGAVRVGHYAGAWALVHALQLGPDELRAPFDAYQGWLSSGRMSEAGAWDRAFSGIDVQAHVDAFLRDGEVAYFEIPHRAPRRERPRATSITPLEAHLHWARLYNLRSPDQGSKALEHVRLAKTHDPGDARPYLVEAAVRLVNRDRIGAGRAIATARRLEPESPRALHAALDFALASAESPDDIDETAAELAEALGRVATSAAQLDTLARYRLLRADPSAARELAARALERDWTCWFCRATYAVALAESGDSSRARAAATAAFNLAPHDAAIDTTRLRNLLEALGAE